MIEKINRFYSIIMKVTMGWLRNLNGARKTKADICVYTNTGS
jgi:hypothetical protein